MEIRTFPIEGIKHLIIDQTARDARVRGDPGAAMVQVTYQPTGRDAAPEFTVEGDAVRFRGAAAIRATLPPDLRLTIVEAAGDLRVEELSAAVELEVVQGDLRLRGLAGPMQISAVSGSLRADGVAGLRISESCGGDLRMHNGGALSAEEVAGDIRLYQVASAHFSRIGGDLWAEKVIGALEVVAAAGDVRLLEIGGLATLQQVAGDLRASALRGGLGAPDVQGDADLRGPYGAPEDYSVTARADITCYLPLATETRLSVQAGGRIRSDIQLTPAPDGSPIFSANLGRGWGHITLRAGGDLRIIQAEGEEPRHTPGATMGDLSARIREHVEASLAAAGISLEGDAVPGGARPGPGAGRTARAGASRPQSVAPPSPGRPSEAEQMAVLKMVQDGTITAQEAELLLRALSGQAVK